MNDVDCPYCGFDQEVCHDDGFGYDEDTLHEMGCEECGKVFVFSTSIMFHYSPEKADCLNGSRHRLRRTHTYPVKHARLRCETCDLEKQIPESLRRQ